MAGETRQTNDKVSVFESHIKQIYPDQYDSVLMCHRIPTEKAVRIVSDTETILATLKASGVVLEETEIPGAYSWSKENQIAASRHPETQKGNIYIQGLSSMLAVLALDPLPSEHVLDLCAAPGSKTSMIAGLVSSPRQVVAVEKSRARFFKMKELLAKAGHNEVVTINSDGNHVIRRFPEYAEYFDKVLVDVPCSNEVNIDLNNQETLETWNPKHAKGLSKLQKGLLNSAYKLTKPGGVIVYSTCTYSVTENEAVVNWLLKRQADVKLDEISLSIKNVASGLTDFGKSKFDQTMNKAVRVLPNERYSGFFIAKIRKVTEGHSVKNTSAIGKVN